MREVKKIGTDVSLVAKASLWYTVCNFLFRGMAFITTPIFARLLTKAELGSFSNYSSWITLLAVVTGFDLQTSIIRSKLEHEKDMDSYIWSILSLTSITTMLLYGIILMFPDFFVQLFQIDIKYIHIMFIYLFVAPAYQMLITKQRAFYKYKMFVALTGITIFSATLLSLVMVVVMNNKYAGRLLGYYLPYIVIGVIIYIYILVKGKKIQIQYWKYACCICLPLVPHALSFYLLSSSDKIIITQFSGSELTAIYSIAYSCYHIFIILLDSMNKAWAPWLLESLHYKKYSEIRQVSKKYITVFAVLTFGILLVVPELILILGGNQYLVAKYCLPPLITSCIFQFIYTMYVNIELYEKKTIGVACATAAAAVLNIVLNLIFIPLSPQNGYIIAAYTTLIGYIVLFILHFLLVKRMGMHHIYDFKFILKILVITLVISAVMNIFYNVYLVRYVFVFIYSSIIILIAYKKKKIIYKIVGKKNN